MAETSGTPLPPAFADLNYDTYRDIRFVPERALWRADNLPFQVQFFHRGFYYKDRIDIYEVADGKSHPIPYRRDSFSFGPDVPKFPDADLGFAGFRLHAPINKPD